MRSRPRYNEAYAPLPARHVAAVLGREPASAGGLNETRPRGQVEGPAGASLWDVHAPAASLGRGPAPTLGDGRPATVLPRAQNKMVRAAIPSLPRPCPVTPPKKRCSSCSSRSPASARRGPLRSPPRLRPRSVGDRRPSSRSSLGLALSGRTLRGPLRSARAPPLCVGIRSGRVVVVAALLLLRSVARFALLPPVSRPARARVLARALADSPVASGDPGGTTLRTSLPVADVQ